MFTYISMLRGINVSGRRLIPMAELRRLYESLESANVRTYLQSGNVVFDSPEREIFLFCPNGYGRTRLSNDFFERRLNTAATTRNWKTVRALSEMAGPWQQSR
jgi:uncharacterized protein (DUF1697 family)